MRVWNARTGGQERRFSLQSQPRTSPGDDANSAVFSPDGRRILVSGDDGAARIWGLASGHVTLVIPASANKTYAASFSPDGRRIVTGSLDGEARVWDPTRPLPGVAGSPPRARLLAVLHAPTGQVLSASFGLDDHTVIAGESGGVARIWDTAGLDHVDSFPDLGDEVLGADFSPDGHRVLTSNANSKTRVWDPRSGRTLRLLTGHKAVRSAEFNPDGSQIVTAGNDGAVRVWKAGRTRPIVLPGPGILLAATFSPDGRSVATAGADGMVRIWNVHDRTHTEFRADQGFVSDVAFSNDGRELATAGQSGASLWDESTGRPLRAPSRSGGEK